VTEGRLTLQVGDDTVIVEAECVVRIPPGVPHAVRNQGPDPARAIAGAHGIAGLSLEKGRPMYQARHVRTDNRLTSRQSQPMQPTKFELVIDMKTAKTFSGSCQATFS